MTTQFPSSPVEGGGTALSLVGESPVPTSEMRARTWSNYLGKRAPRTSRRSIALPPNFRAPPGNPRPQGPFLHLQTPGLFPVSPDIRAFPLIPGFRAISRSPRYLRAPLCTPQISGILPVPPNIKVLPCTPKYQGPSLHHPDILPAVLLPCIRKDTGRSHSSSTEINAHYQGHQSLYKGSGCSVWESEPQTQ